MRPNNDNKLRWLWERVLKLIKAVDEKEEEKLEIELVGSNVEEYYELAERALQKLDAQIWKNKRLRQEARELHAYARSINEIFG